MNIRCSQCEKRFRVGEKFAGKRVKCPNCGGPIRVPAPTETAAGEPAEQASPEDVSPAEASPEDAAGEAAGEAGGTAPEEGPAERPEQPRHQAPEAEGRWYLQTDDGEQYGPVDRRELNEWFGEGRIDQTCQLLCDGWDQWRWADEVFSGLRDEEVQPPTTAPHPRPSAVSRAGGVSGVADAGDAEAVRAVLAATRPWVLVMAIVGLALGGLMLLGGLVSLVLILTQDAPVLTAVAVGLAVTGGVQGWTAYLLLTRAKQMGHSIRYSQPTHLEKALHTQRAVGILALVTLGLCVLGGVFAAVLATMIALG
ncbi:MAG: GYF domain-containing protein [Pirellulales bacterium]